MNGLLYGECPGTWSSKSLHQNPQYRKPVAERLTISMQGQPRKKAKDKDRAKEKEAAAAESGAEPAPPATPAAGEE